MNVIQHADSTNASLHSAKSNNSNSSGAQNASTYQQSPPINSLYKNEQSMMYNLFQQQQQIQSQLKQQQQQQQQMFQTKVNNQFPMSPVTSIPISPMSSPLLSPLSMSPNSAYYTNPQPTNLSTQLPSGQSFTPLTAKQTSSVHANTAATTINSNTNTTNSSSTQTVTNTNTNNANIKANNTNENKSNAPNETKPKLDTIKFYQIINTKDASATSRINRPQTLIPLSVTQNLSKNVSLRFFVIKKRSKKLKNKRRKNY